MCIPIQRQERASGKGKKRIVEGAAQEKQSTPVPTRYPGPVSILDSSCRGRPGSLLGEMHWEDSPT